jgi:CDP-glucose 4,6-dehydratase
MDRPEVCGETFSFTTGTPVNVLTVVETILRLMQRMDLKPTILREETNEIPVKHMPSSKPRTELGWRPESSLESGLEKTIAWYRSHAAEVRLEDQN